MYFIANAFDTNYITYDKYHSLIKRSIKYTIDIFFFVRIFFRVSTAIKILKHCIACLRSMYVFYYSVTYTYIVNNGILNQITCFGKSYGVLDIAHLRNVA